jgi:hypothetical protein
LADVLCPMEKQLRPMKDCLSCEKHITNGTSLEWCGYRPQKVPQPTEIPINALMMQMQRKLGKAQYFYKTGKTQIADNLSNEAAWLEMKIRRIKKNVQDA